MIVPLLGTVYIYVSDLRPRDVPFGPDHIDSQILMPKYGFEEAATFLCEVARKWKGIDQGK